MNIYKATYHQIVYHQHGYHVPNSYFNRMMAVWPFTRRQITPLKHLLQTTHWSVKQLSYSKRYHCINTPPSPQICFANWLCSHLNLINLFPFFSQRQLNIKGYQCSTNLEFVLFKHNVKNVSECYSNILTFPQKKEPQWCTVIRTYLLSNFKSSLFISDEYNENFFQTVAFPFDRFSLTVRSPRSFIFVISLSIHFNHVFSLCFRPLFMRNFSPFLNT